MAVAELILNNGGQKEIDCRNNVLCDNIPCYFCWSHRVVWPGRGDGSDDGLSKRTAVVHGAAVQQTCVRHY